MISIQPNLHALVGLAVTILFGFGVGCIVRCAGKSMEPLPPPSAGMASVWEKLILQKTGGRWIGFIERPIFFAALWGSGAWPVLSSWLVFKLAFYWQGTNFSTFPQDPPKTAEEVEYLLAKRQLGTHQVATALVGTGANIVLALIGVAVGRWIILP
jgi:hypothetical protein